MPVGSRSRLLRFEVPAKAMIQVVGSVIVLACVLGGFILEGGHVLALWHPTEILIIVGAAFGAFLTSNPPKVSKAAFQGALAIPKGPKYRREDYVALLKLVYDILMKIRKDGVMAIENDLEKPEASPLFKKYPVVLADHHMVVFITDCLRLIVGGNLDPHELESLLEYELETHHKEAHEPAHAVQKVADALPGFGIVAAVLGIVNTMASLEGADTATIGHKVGAALVGTFLGIFLSYAVVGPIATKIKIVREKQLRLYIVVKQTLLGFMNGAMPQVALEHGRKIISENERPSIDVVEGETISMANSKAAAERAA
jgi:chemotaxis protein MotA